MTQPGPNPATTNDTQAFLDTISRLRQADKVRPGMRVMIYPLNMGSDVSYRMSNFQSDANRIIREAVERLPEEPTADYMSSFPQANVFALGNPQSLYIATNGPELHSKALSTMGRPMFQTVVEP